MRPHRALVLLGSTALVAFGAPAWAQTAATTSAAQEPEAATVEDVVVTARRTSERLQDVPQTVTAVTGQEIQKLNFTQFQDITAAVPGLSLGTSSIIAGRSPAPAIRGVSYDGATPSPTVDIYLNEVPIPANLAFNALYDTGGIQVLRGPQGTLRGRTAPSGALLIGSQNANANTFGGYASGLVATQDAYNAQGAVNVPVIDGVLGLRFAADYDRNAFSGIRSTNDPRDPYKETKSGRISARFTPTESFRADLTYQHNDIDSLDWTQVAGNGAVGGVNPRAPAGYNGRPIDPSDRAAAGHTPRFVDDKTDIVTLNAEWDVLGHTLSYVGGYVTNDNSTVSSADYGNAVPAADLSSTLNSTFKQITHELRLSSSGDNRFVDYSVGYFRSETKNDLLGGGIAAILAGGYGSPAAPTPFTYNSRYTLSTVIRSVGDTTEDSIFGNLTFHLPADTELTVGGRYIMSKGTLGTRVDLTSGFIAVAIPVPCSFVGFTASPYAGYCDVPIAASTTPVLNTAQTIDETPSVYSVSLSHKFTPDILAYATVGSSWRQGGANTGLSNGDNDPLLAALAFTPNETSTSYETGVKTSWMDGRLRANLAVFYQDFTDLVFTQNSVPFQYYDGATRQASSTNVVVGADAIIKGFDLDVAFQPLDNWSMSLAVSYADGKVDNDLVPCRDSNFDGVPDSGTPTLADFQSRNLHIAQCVSNQSVSTMPLWNATVQSEYFVPVGPNTDGYIRALANYYPSNDRASAGYEVPSYSMVNLYAGIRSSDRGWDIGVFARNLFDTGVQTSREPALLTTTYDSAFGSAGYRFVTYTPPRQIGFTVRYAFGG